MLSGIPQSSICSRKLQSAHLGYCNCEILAISMLRKTNIKALKT
jgi:hypothetical protein